MFHISLRLDDYRWQVELVLSSSIRTHSHRSIQFAKRNTSNALTQLVKLHSLQSPLNQKAPLLGFSKSRKELHLPFYFEALNPAWSIRTLTTAPRRTYTTENALGETNLPPRLLYGISTKMKSFKMVYIIPLPNGKALNSLRLFVLHHLFTLFF